MLKTAFFHMLLCGIRMYRHFSLTHPGNCSRRICVSARPVPHPFGAAARSKFAPGEFVFRHVLCLTPSGPLRVPNSLPANLCFGTSCASPLRGRCAFQIRSRRICRVDNFSGRDRLAAPLPRIVPLNRAVSPSPGPSDRPLPVGEGKSVRPPAAGSWKEWANLGFRAPPGLQSEERSESKRPRMDFFQHPYRLPDPFTDNAGYFMVIEVTVELVRIQSLSAYPESVNKMVFNSCQILM